MSEVKDNAVVAQAPAIDTQKGTEIGKRFLTRIARFTDSEANVGNNAICINGKGIQMFVPKVMRDDIAEGDFVIAVEKQYHSQGIDEQGRAKEIGGVPVYDGPMFTRTDIIFAGDYDTVSETFYEDEVLESMHAHRVTELVTSFKTERKLKKAPAAATVKKDGQAVHTEPTLGS